MKSILLPTDFSNNSLNAIKYAVNMFKDIPCDFYLLNVQKASSFISDDMMVMSASTTIYETLISAAKKSIENIISKIETKYKNEKHQFHSIVDYDNLIDSINQTCNIHNIDLIVMGTKGASGFKKVIFGSNTVHVMQRCPVPVLAIPDNYKFSGLNKVAFSTNHLALNSVSELKPLKDLFSIFKFDLDILHIRDEDNAYYEVFNNETFFQTNFNNVKHHYLTIKVDAILKSVQNYIDVNSIEMLAIMNKKHAFLQRLFKQYLVETIAFKVDVPFLVMPKTETL